MINTRALTRPSPSDANLLPSTDGLTMALEGGNDLNRFFYYKGVLNKSINTINNMTSNPFNHTFSTGGYHDSSKAFTGSFTANNKSGVIPFPSLSLQQSTRDEMSNNPYPWVNAIVAPQIVHPRIIDSIPPMFSNPLLAR